MSQRRGFFQELFDFSFSHFITLKIVGILYGLGIFFAGLVALGITVASFDKGFLSGVGSLVIAPLLFLLYIIIIRVALEGMWKISIEK